MYTHVYTPHLLVPTPLSLLGAGDGMSHELPLPAGSSGSQELRDGVRMSERFHDVEEAGEEEEVEGEEEGK